MFRWQGHYWMAVDHWQGLGVYQSDDSLRWKRQATNLLEQPGHGPDDQVNLAVVRAARPSGKIMVTASGPGLAAETVTFTIHN